jgi:hypothetical protein
VLPAAWLYLRPALLGPLATISAVVTVSVLLGYTDPLVGGPFANWLFGMFVGTFVACGMTGVLMLVDIVLLRLGVRRLPTGRRAWGGACATTLGALVGYEIWPPGGHPIGARFLLAMLGPGLVIAAALRLALGRRPVA